MGVFIAQYVTIQPGYCSCLMVPTGQCWRALSAALHHTPLTICFVAVGITMDTTSRIYSPWYYYEHRLCVLILYWTNLAYHVPGNGKTQIDVALAWK